MNILVPIDGTEHSLRAVEFLTTRTDLLGEHPHITIFMAQMPVPQRVFMNILVPIDGTEHSLRAVEFLTTRTDLLGEHPHITIFMAQMPVPQRVLAGVQPIAVDDFYKEEANTVFASVRALLGNSPLDVDMRYSVGMPANDIVAEADRLDADLIIMGIRGHGPVNSFLFGSVSNAVLAHTHRPILMLKDKLPEGTKNLRVGLAVDGSEYSERAVDYVLSHRPLSPTLWRYTTF